MRKIFISVFIISLFFIENAMAVRLVSLGNSVVKAAKHFLLPKSTEEMRRSLENLEMEFWGKSLSSGKLSEAEIRQTMDSGFNPKELLQKLEKFRAEANFVHPEVPSFLWESASESVLVRVCLAMMDYVDTPVFLRWLDQPEFRKYTFFYIYKSDLAENSEFLLKWWDEAKIQGEGEMMESYMRSSFQEVVDVFPPDEVMESLTVDPFLDRVFRTMRENTIFSNDMKPILEKLFKEFGIDQGGRVGNNGV